MLENENASMKPKAPKKKNWYCYSVVATLIVTALVLAVVFGAPWSWNSTQDIKQANLSDIENEAEKDVPGKALSYTASGSCYATALAWKEKTDQMDYPSIYAKLSAGNYLSVQEYFSNNSEAYELLLANPEETITFGICHLLEHINELDAHSAQITELDLIYAVTRQLLEGVLSQDTTEMFFSLESRREQMYFLEQYTFQQWLLFGNEKLQELQPGLYLVLNAVAFVPEFRLSFTSLEGNVYSSAILSFACEQFCVAFHEAEMGERTEIPNVVNLSTSWTLSQTEDYTVSLVFCDSTTGTVLGKMTYIPSEEQRVWDASTICGTVKYDFSQSAPN